MYSVPAGRLSSCRGSLMIAVSLIILDRDEKSPIENRLIPSCEFGLIYRQSKPILELVNEFLYQFSQLIGSLVVKQVSKLRN